MNVASGQRQLSQTFRRSMSQETMTSGEYKRAFGPWHRIGRKRPPGVSSARLQLRAQRTSAPPPPEALCGPLDVGSVADVQQAHDSGPCEVDVAHDEALREHRTVCGRAPLPEGAPDDRRHAGHPQAATGYLGTGRRRVVEDCRQQVDQVVASGGTTDPDALFRRSSTLRASRATTSSPEHVRHVSPDQR